MSSICQLCANVFDNPVIDLGAHPLGDHFLKEEELTQPEHRYPLVVTQCPACGHAQLLVDVPASERYQTHDYSYTASNSAASRTHFEELAQWCVVRHPLTTESLVVDIGSNDGTLLSYFKEQTGCVVHGVDPSRNIAALAVERGIPTIVDLFGPSAVVMIGKKADIITSTNTFNHISDVCGFMDSIDSALAPDGIFVFEVPYLLDLVRQTAFDTIYLEHILFFAVKPFAAFFASRGYAITHVERTAYMGGSIRVAITRGTTHAPEAAALIAEEEAAQLFSPTTYIAFMERVRGLRERLMSELHDLLSGGAVVMGVGAATKGNTMLNYCGITTAELRCVTDSSPFKIGKYTPGSHVPIRSDDALREATHALILPWNIADLLQKKLQRPGLSFIIPRI